MTWLSAAANMQSACNQHEISVKTGKGNVCRDRDPGERGVRCVRCAGGGHELQLVNLVGEETVVQGGEACVRGKCQGVLIGVLPKTSSMKRKFRVLFWRIFDTVGRQ